jgi:ubiquinone/menaquinone biosynthesis C-methylase UbiE
MSEIVEEEISRLQRLGWVDQPADEFGVRPGASKHNSQISFPDSAYDTDFKAGENVEFWVMHRAESIGKVLSANNVKLIWEVGAGSGNVALNLKNYNVDVIATEPIESGARLLAGKKIRAYSATLEELNFPSNSIQAIGMFDVLEHIADTKPVLEEIFRVLSPGGLFISTVPAHQWLFSDFDEAIGHFRRYSKRTLTSELERSGLQVLQMKYLFGFLVLPAIVLRRIPFLFGRRSNFTQVSKDSKWSGKLGKLLSVPINLILRIEKRLEPPTGLTIVSLCRKPN